MRFGKNILSQNLRTRCDLALYLTLFTPGDLIRAGLPPPIKSRPLVESLQQAGIDQENLIYDLLVRGLADRCIGPRRSGQKQWPDQPMGTALAAVTHLPSVILQPKMELGPVTEAIYDRLGVVPGHRAIMPSLEGLIPDILLAVAPDPQGYEVLPNAERSLIPEGDRRIRLCVVDVKHARDPNPSYSAEVVLYAVMLANWLEDQGLSDRFLVLSKTFLWTRGGLLRDRLRLAVERDDRTPEAVIAAAQEELEPINTAIYLQTIRRFFTERLPAIIEQGNADWLSLEWGVGPACGSCDWLAYPSYLNSEQRTLVEADPHRYCYQRAQVSDHLSRIPLLTRGSRRVMRRGGMDTVAAVAVTTGMEPVYDEHTRLHAERVNVPAYARAIITRTPATDAHRKDGLLARYADLDVFVSVNFDVGSGLVTGIAARARFNQHTDYGQPRSNAGSLFRTAKWVTPTKTTGAEQVTLLAFLQFLAGIFEHAYDRDPNKGGPRANRTGTQIVFWTERQFEELCLAMGRHLPVVLFDPNNSRILKSLAWLFPPEELQEKDEIDPTSPVIAFVQRTLNRLVRTPSEHAVTLFRVAEHYRYQRAGAPPWRAPDTFYSEPFSDSIPRERIYEIWRLSELGGGQTIRWGSIHKTLSELTEAYAAALVQQVSTLSDIARQLRGDFGSRLRAKADTLSLTVPAWTRGVAPDAKLLIGWAAFESAYSKAAAFTRFFKDPEEIEASYEGIRLTRLLRALPDGSLKYEISERSLNTKLRVPDDYVCLSVDGEPGFLSLRVGDVLGWRAVPQDQGNWRMHRIFAASLLEIDRAGRTARIYLKDGQSGSNRILRTCVLNQLGASLNGGLTVLRGLGSDIQVQRMQAILQEVGNPAIAVPAPETASALGTASQFPRGRDPVTPIARVLWDAPNLAVTPLHDDSEVDAIVGTASGLDSSQRTAVQHAARMALTVLWGPPGTGKTRTGTTFIHGVVRYEAPRRHSSPYAILLTGPNYKAVSELAGRVVEALAADASALCRIYFVASEARAHDLRLPSSLPPHLMGAQIHANEHDQGFQQLANDLEHGTNVVLVATVVHQCPRIAGEFGKLRNDNGGYVRRLFDLIFIDESSQVDMTTGIGPLALLKERFQLVVAGDHLQMPPVFQVDPPVGAEHLVGSLQTYLVKRFSVATKDLLENYRSHQDLVSYTKRLGYPPGLTAANPATRLHWLRPVSIVCANVAASGGAASDSWEELLDTNRPIVSMTYPDGMAGQANPFEAECVASIARALFLGTSCSLDGRSDQDTHAPWTDEGFWSTGLGVVTPHRAQRAQVVSSLIRLFPRVNPDLIEGAVDTVERFQGGERHTILISFGVGDPDVISGEEEFLLQLERTNVAVSRTMAKCIVVISEEMAGHLPESRKAAGGAHALRGIVDEWCNRSRSTAVILPDGSRRDVRIRWRG